MNIPKFKKNEWCLFNYSLAEVLISDETGIHALAGLNFSYYSPEDLSSRCFALHPQLIAFAKECEIAERHFYAIALPYNTHVNCRERISGFWDKMCENRNDLDKITAVQKEFREWITAHTKMLSEVLDNRPHVKKTSSGSRARKKPGTHNKLTKKTLQPKTSKRRS